MTSTKRLRGWALQKEMAEDESANPSSSSSSKPESALATKLLSLWAHGLLAATAIRELAHLAILDGADHHELAALAKAGNFGEQPGNISRDIMTKFCKQVDLSDPTTVKALAVDPKTSNEEEVEAGCFLPHLVFSALAINYPEQFSQMFGVQTLNKFWTNAEKTEDDRLDEHPMTASSGWKDVCIPLFIHADGVEYHTRDTLMSWSWGGLLNSISSLDGHLMLAIFPKSCTCTGTWEPIMEVLCWSFTAMLSGKHPVTDWKGNPIRKGSVFFEKAGQPLTPGNHKGIIWSIQGDHEMFSNVLKLPHWRNRSPCWECNATQDTLQVIQPSLQDHVLIDSRNAALHPKSNHLMFKIPGVTSRLVRGDCLHILWHNGLYGHLLGSILHMMCWSDPISTPQRVQPARRLAIIFEQAQIEYKSQQAPTRLTNLKLSMVCSVKAPHASFPGFHAKAAETKHFAPALLAVCRRVFDPASEVHDKMVKALASVCDLAKLFDAADMYLTTGEFNQALSLAESFLDHYAWLHTWAEEHDRKLFHTGPLKFHTFWHLALNSKYLNPRVHWTFRNEDYVGRISTLTHSISMGVKATKLSLKACYKYRILLHLRLTRANFGSCPATLD
jgi:hypothetical protein